MRWTTSQIAAVVDGQLNGPDVEIDRFTQDSREIDPGVGSWLFVPLIAERDGHDFVPAAVSAGAAATLGSVEVDAGDAAVIRVADTAEALTALGAAARNRLKDAVVVGITGSVGKTSTKDMLAAVLRHDRPTHANTRSFNNEIGVPLTLLAAPERSEAVVLEMGARGIGHIAALCRTARPTVGIVTTVGAAHTSEFGSVEAIAQGKGELVEALPSDADGGVAVLNADVGLVANMASRTAAQVVTFGEAGDVRAERLVVDEELVPSFRLVSPWGDGEVRLGVRGAHLVDNALASAAAALAVDVPMGAVVAGLAEPAASPMRMDVQRSASGARIIDDSYNANPLSVAAALRALAALPAVRRVAVLGVMAELGESSANDHQDMAELASSLGIEVVAVDAEDYGDGVEHVADPREVLDALGEVGAGDAVLVKGSRVAGLERVVAALLD